MFDIFYRLLSGPTYDEGMIPARHQHIVRATIDLKTDIEFGYAFNRDQASYTELLGSRAYQRALDRHKAEENERLKNQT